MSEKLEEMSAGYVEAEHSPTPWATDMGYISSVPINDVVALTVQRNYGLNVMLANADRIAACVNACEGLTNEQLIKTPVLELLKKTCESHNQERLDKKIQDGIAYRLQLERDELLAVLRQIAIMPAAMHNIEAADKMSRMAWDAIAKAGG